MNYIKEKYKNLIIKFVGNILRPRFGWKKKITKTIKFVYLLLELPFEFIGDIIFLPKRFKKFNIENPKKILIIKTDQFGDVLFSTFLLPIIKKNHPDAKIDYLINPKTEVLLKKNPNINKLYYWSDPFLYFLMGRNEKRMSFLKLIKECIKCIKDIRLEKYDIIINTRAYPPSTNIFLKLMKPKAIIAFDISEQGYIADAIAKYGLRDEDWKNYLNLLSPFCKNVYQSKFEPQFENFDDGVFNKLPGLSGKIVMISPISFDTERRWPDENWKDVIRFLLSLKYTVVLTALPSQQEVLKKLAEGMNAEKIVFATNFSISEIASILRKSEFWIGIDSFTAHLAIALKKKTICLLNEKYYFLKGMSKKVWVDAKSMIPIIDDVMISSVSEGSEKIISEIKNITQSH